ncbi:hypothetical protein [Rhizobium sp. L51/94]|uniref:hypothetical protein n=1 Tax=Rhizobium sp. L51/94 TaxID=2819999 RepID=UPI001C5B49A7|nr:hypothetical protein [Rhizobium sp. L51/94]QXZ79639.1 hypothetical protein J5274_06560 [Rhizobium sp. L51/94]
MNPDFSPAMLKSFLRIRVGHAANVSFPSPRGSAERAAKTQLRLASGVSSEDFDKAWKGLLTEPEACTRIWSALGIAPATVGIRLIANGRQEAINGA